MQTCYRCNKSLPEKFFEPPVTLCLICYGTSRGNQGLTIAELRDKARKARKGRVLNTPYREELQKALMADAGMYECPTCKVLVVGEPAMNDDCVFDRLKLACGHVIIPEEDDGSEDNNP